MIIVKFGIGQEYPGKTFKSKHLASKDACFTNEMKALFQDSQASISNSEDDNFVWVSVTDGNGESLFELEDRLLEWLEDES